MLMKLLSIRISEDSTSVVQISEGLLYLDVGRP